MRYDGTNIGKVEIYGIFNAAPFVEQIIRTAHWKYGLAVNWEETVQKMRHILTIAVADHCRVSESVVLIDVVVHTPITRTKVLIPHEDAVEAMHSVLNAETVESYIEFYPKWGYVDYGYNVYLTQ